MAYQNRNRYQNQNQKKRLYSALPMEEPRTWAEIDLSAIRHNYRAVVDHVHRITGMHDLPVICVVKADGYGHGAGAVARTLLEEGCRFFAVSCIEEGEELRGVCREMGQDADILILGYTRPDLARQLAKFDLISALPSTRYARELARNARRAGVTVRVHAKLDTGMNRIGLPAHNASEISEAIHDLALLSRERGLALEGLFTHFARADEDAEHVATGLTETQYGRFLAVKNGLEMLGLGSLMCHVCNSAGAIRLPDCALDAVRVGISLYGCSPSDAVGLPDLRPAMRLMTMISHVHTLRVGETVSYGGTFRADRERRIATLPIGYADGFTRAYSGAKVWVMTDAGTFRAPIVGRICMDQCMIDVTDIPAEIGDEVALFGIEPSDIEELAQRAGTISYEVLCLVSARVPRRYI